MPETELRPPDTLPVYTLHDLLDAWTNGVCFGRNVNNPASNIPDFWAWFHQTKISRLPSGIQSEEENPA